jgi:CheY-like chemotaxis protein
MRVTTEADPLQAIDVMHQAKAEGHPFELALLDHAMPGIDGVELARRIHADAHLKDIPLMLLTSSGQRGDSARYQTAGFSAYLLKPVLIDTLRRSMASVLGIHASDDANKPLVTQHTVAESIRCEQRQAPRLSGRILLAEDNMVNRQVALAMLSKLGLKADIAENGREAVEHFAPDTYDLILMDCQMPEMDGYRATQSSRAIEGGKHIPIVALTANVMESDRQKCIDAGMSDYLAKPFKLRELQSLLEDWLARAG